MKIFQFRLPERTLISTGRRESDGNQALDFIEVNVRQGFEYLGEIIGETVSDTIIDEVFSRFCLGK